MFRGKSKRPFQGQLWLESLLGRQNRRKLWVFIKLVIAGGKASTYFPSSINWLMINIISLSFLSTPPVLKRPSGINSPSKTASPSRTSAKEVSHCATCVMRPGGAVCIKTFPSFHLGIQPGQMKVALWRKVSLWQWRWTYTELGIQRNDIHSSGTRTDRNGDVRRSEAAFAWPLGRNRWNFGHRLENMELRMLVSSILHVKRVSSVGYKR